MNDHFEIRIAVLKGRIETMVEYLRLRLDMRDWHGVQDAASDIREMEAQLRVLEDIK